MIQQHREKFAEMFNTKNEDEVFPYRQGKKIEVNTKVGAFSGIFKNLI
jgi:hypothetical protein